MKKEVNTFAEYMADETRVTQADREMIDFEVSLIGKLIEAREKKEISQRELAEIMETTPQTLGYTLAIVPIE